MPSSSARRRGSRRDDVVKVRIPTPLRSYTDQQTVVDAAGTTVAELLHDLECNQLWRVSLRFGHELSFPSRRQIKVNGL